MATIGKSNGGVVGAHEEKLEFKEQEWTLRVLKLRDEEICQRMISQISCKFQFTSLKFQENNKDRIALLSTLDNDEKKILLASLVSECKEKEMNNISLNPTDFEKKLLLKDVVDYSFVSHPLTVYKISQLLDWYNNLITKISNHKGQKAILQYCIADAPRFSKTLKTVLNSSGISHSLIRLNKARCIQGIAFRDNNLPEGVERLEIKNKKHLSLSHPNSTNLLV